MGVDKKRAALGFGGLGFAGAGDLWFGAVYGGGGGGRRPGRPEAKLLCMSGLLWWAAGRDGVHGDVVKGSDGPAAVLAGHDFLKLDVQGTVFEGFHAGR